MKKELRICDWCHKKGIEKISSRTCPFCGVDMCTSHSLISLDKVSADVRLSGKARITADSDILYACLDCYNLYDSELGKNHANRIFSEVAKKIKDILNDFVNDFMSFGYKDEANVEDEEVGEGHEGSRFRKLNIGDE